jgi:hypothetical protein
VAPAYAPALAGWGSAALAAGRPPTAVAARIRSQAPDSADAGLLSLLGDALRLAADDEGAERAYAAAEISLPSFAHQARQELRLRRRMPAAAVRALHDPHAKRAAGDLWRVSVEHPVAWSAAAGRLLEAGDPAAALAAMRRAPAGTDPAAEAARMAAIARYARFAGRPAEAARFAAASARAWRAAGAPAPAAQQEDRAAEARWLALPSD